MIGLKDSLLFVATLVIICGCRNNKEEVCNLPKQLQTNIVVLGEDGIFSKGKYSKYAVFLLQEDYGDNDIIISVKQLINDTIIIVSVSQVNCQWKKYAPNGIDKYFYYFPYTIKKKSLKFNYDKGKQLYSLFDSLLNKKELLCDSNTVSNNNIFIVYAVNDKHYLSKYNEHLFECFIDLSKKIGIKDFINDRNR